MTQKQRKIYWHLIIWTNPDADPTTVPGTVGTAIGLERKRDRWDGIDKVRRDFCPSARLAFLGAVPADYHERYPEEASRRLNLWSARYLAEHPIDEVS